MGLFGSWFDDLLGGGGTPTSSAPISVTPTQAPIPAPAPPDAITQLQQMLQQRANPSPFQKILGALGGGLKDFAHPEGPQNNISSYFGGIDQAKVGMLAQNALGQVMNGANADPTSGQLPNDLPLKLAKLQMMGVDITPIQTMLGMRAAQQPKYTKDDMGNIWSEVPGKPPQLISVGPGKVMSGKEPQVSINPYGGGAAAPATGGPAPPSAPPSGNAAAALDYFQKAGFSPAAAAGIVGNLQYESGLDPNKPTSTPGENGFGIAQWGPARAAQFQQVMGKPLRGSSLQDQLAFTKWELTQGPYANVGNALKQTTDPRAATDLVLNKYENPANPAASQATREGYATGYMGTPPAMLAQSGQTATDAPSGMGWTPSDKAIRDKALNGLLTDNTRWADLPGGAIASPSPSGARVLYDPGLEVTPIGQVSPELRSAYPGASGMKRDGTPIYPPGYSVKPPAQELPLNEHELASLHALPGSTRNSETGAITRATATNTAPDVSPEQAKAMAFESFLNGGKPVQGRDQSTNRIVGKVLNTPISQGGIRPDAMKPQQWANLVISAGISTKGKTAAAQQLAKLQSLTAINESAVNNSIGIVERLLPTAASRGKFTDVNEFMQYLGRKTNDAGAVNLANGINTIANEYARIMTGSTSGAPTSDAARDDAKARVLTGYNAGTIHAVLDQMRAEMRGRSDAQTAGISALTNGLFSGIPVQGQGPQGSQNSGTSKPTRTGHWDPASGRVIWQ